MTPCTARPEAPARKIPLRLPALVLAFPLLAAATPATTDPSETLTYEGTGDTVLQVDVHDEPRVATFSHNGGSNFAVWAVDSLGENQDLLVNTIGPYEGQSRLPAGAFLLAITSEGDWTLTR